MSDQSDSDYDEVDAAPRTAPAAAKAPSAAASKAAAPGAGGGSADPAAEDAQELTLERFVAEALPRTSTTAKRTARTEALRELHRRLQHAASAEAPDQLLLAVFNQLALAAPRFQDSPSIKATAAVLADMHAISHARSKHPVECSLLLIAAKILSKEVSASLHATALFVFAKWTSKIIGLALGAAADKEAAVFAASPSFVTLLNLHASLLDWIAASQARREPLFSHRAREATVRALVRAGPAAARTVLGVVLTAAAVDGKEHQRLAMIIGAAVRAAERSGSVDDLAAFKDGVVKFFAKTILVSKTVVPTHYLSALEPFIARFVDEDVYKAEIMSAADRLLLRSPEVAIKVIDLVTRAVPFDVGPQFRDKFADTLLNQLKSTNETVRRDAAAFYATLSRKSAVEADLVAVVDVIAKGMSAKSPMPDHRAVYFSLIAGLPASAVVSAKVLSAIPPLAAKESNEPALLAALDAFGKHFAAYLALGVDAIDAKIAVAAAAFLITGSKDAKLGVRKAHLAAVGALARSPAALSALDRDATVKMIDAMIAVADKVQAAGIALLDSKKETPAFVEACIAVQFVIAVMLTGGPSVVAHLEGKKFFAQTLALSSAKAFMFNERFYGKLLLSSDEQMAFLDVVNAIVRDAPLYGRVVKDDADVRVLANAIVWALVHSSPAVRRQASDSLAGAVAASADALERAVTLVRLGLGHIFAGTSAPGTTSAVAADAVDPAANMWNDRPVRSSAELGQRALVTLLSVLPPSPDEALKPTLVLALMDLAVIMSLPLMVHLHGADLWVRMCFRCDLDPREVLEQHAASYIGNWLHSTSRDVTIGGLAEALPAAIRAATVSCLRLATEVATDVVLPLVLPFAFEILRDDSLAQVSRTDVLIWATPADELFDDPLQKKAAQQEERARNADDKWERELKKEIEAKRAKAGGKAAPGSADAKLSKADRELRQQQFAAEAAVRARVAEHKARVRLALDVLEAVLEGVLDSIGPEAREAFGVWTADVLETLMAVVERELVTVRRGKSVVPCGALAGSRAVSLLFELGHASVDYLGDEVTIDGVLAFTLRAIGVDEKADHGIPAKYLSGTLAGTTRKMAEELAINFSASAPLEAPAFALVFPLLRAVIAKEGRIAQLKEKTHTALVMACSDVLLSHCTIPGPHRLVPRHDMALCLVRLLDEFPRLRVAARGGLLALTIAAAGEDEDGEDKDDKESTTQAAGAVDNTTTGVSLVLLDGTLSDEESVRESALAGLSHLPIADAVQETFDTRVWVARSDASEAVRAEALKLWEDVRGADAVVSEALIPEMVRLTVHPAAAVRESAGRALCAALAVYPREVAATLEALFGLYSEKAADPVPEYDDYGMVIPESLNRPDEWQARAGIAHALKACVPVLGEANAMAALFEFLIAREALGDRNSTVQQRMLDAGLSAISESGKQHVRDLLDRFDGYLSQPAKASETHDRIREGVVILLGTVAQHLDATDPRIPEVVDKLIATLETPSELVQVAVSECLPALIKVSKERAPRLIATLMDRLYTAPKYGSRRGAAYGLAGIVKGYGIAALKECNVMTSLRLAVEDKKTPNRREGALFAYETLSYTLGRSFEPYVIQILPFLLVCFGDSSKQIREATEDTCRVIMSKLSAHCVKLVLPSLIDGLSDKAWRTKTGSLEVMASMSALAPKQLSQSLPMIVPSICDALTDSHQKVQEAARQALVTFGNVIKNPEIQEIVPTLIAALVDPNHQTLAALSALLDTTFVHYIDAPSLALLVPIIHRGMRERSADIKKRAAQIMGNMSSLTDQRDLVPYLRTLVPALKEVLVDPVPEARSTAAKAFGSMIEKLGEDNFPGLVAELLQTLKSDASSVDRSGAAQGLSEVLAGLGLERLEGMLPEIVASTSSARMFVREGFMTLLVYLPATFGEAFTPYIATIIPSILQGLADEGETVREVALRAGQVVVRGYAKSAINLLLPELERGLFDNNWRIRQNSMQLLGDLLFRIAGVSSKIDTDASGDQDEGLGTEHGRQALRDALGRERYETVLASVYIIRGDASAVVRQSSLHVWKAIVTNTPRTLKEILPHIMRILIASLASSNLEKRGVAARTLGDLVRKMGENVLAEIVPIFESGLDSDLADVREGVCVGMTEIMAAAGKSQLVDFVVYSTPLIKRALVDPEPSVREAAAQTFDVLHQHLGNKAIDDILPSLLNDLKTDATGFALEALKEIMAVRSNVVFPVLIPTLITRPITQFNAQALGSLISVAGLALNRRLATILPALMDALHQNDDAVPAVRETLGVLLSSIQGDDGVHQAIGIMTEAVRDGSTADKESGCEAFGLFFEGASESFEPYIGDSMQMLIGMLSGTDGDKVLESSWRAVDALVKRIKKDDMDRYVSVVRRGVRDAELCLSVGEDIPGFNIPKGLAPILPILLQGLMYGSPDTREQAALGLGEVVGRTSEAALKPYVTQITGPLIRVIGDRFPANVKSAILQTMALLLDRVPAMLRPFLPQLQRTFVKSLSDGAGTAAMRSRAARCLSLLIPLQARLDPLVVELSQSLKTTEDGSIKPAVWEALYGLLKGVGEGGREISDASRKLLHGLVVDPLQNNRENDTVERTGASKCLGAFCLCIPADEARAIIRQNMLTTGEERPWYLVHAALLSLARILEDAPAVIEGDNELVDQVAELACAALLDTKGEVTDIAVEVAGRLLSNGGFGQSDRAHTLIERLIEVTAPGIRSNETRREAAVVLKNLAKSSHKTIAPFMGKLVPALMVGVRDRVIPIKLASERALVHVLQIKAGTRVLQKYLDMLDAASARNIGDYARRVLAKIGERDSDAEDAVFD